MLVEPGCELFRREPPVALYYELTDLLPVRVFGELHPDSVIAASRAVERVANRQQRLAFARVGAQHELRDGLAAWGLERHEQTERPPADVERVRRRSRSDS